MRSACTIKVVSLLPRAKERVRDRFAIGEIVNASIIAEAVVNNAYDLEIIHASVKLKEQRNYDQLKLYWWCMEWMSLHTPEDISRKYGIFSKYVWHEHVKGSFGITSIAFDNLEQDDFQEYLDFTGSWMYERFGATIPEVMEYMADLKKNTMEEVDGTFNNRIAAPPKE